MQDKQKGFGDRLQDLLNDLDVSQVEFSKETGIVQPLISLAINGKRILSRNSLRKIADRYPEANLQYLLTGAAGALNERDAHNKRKTNSFKKDAENITKRNTPANLATICEHWKMSAASLFSMLSPGTARGTVVRIMAGESLPDLPAMIRLEAVTGIPVSVLATEEITAEDLPEKPYRSDNQLHIANGMLRRANKLLWGYIQDEQH